MRFSQIYSNSIVIQFGVCVGVIKGVKVGVGVKNGVRVGVGVTKSQYK